MFCFLPRLFVHTIFRKQGFCGFIRSPPTVKKEKKKNTCHSDPQTEMTINKMLFQSAWSEIELKDASRARQPTRP